MAKVSTKEIFDRYFDRKSEEITRKTRGQIERPELYEYEKKIGKSFLDMNADDLVGLFIYYKDAKNDATIYRSYDIVIGAYKWVFQDYINNFDNTMINPANDPKLKAPKMNTLLQIDGPLFDDEKLKRLLIDIYASTSPHRAHLIELCIWLLYYGVSDLSVMPKIKEKDIDFDNKVIDLGSYTVKVSDRVIQLMQMNHSEDYFDTLKSVLTPWRGSYIRFFCREASVNTFDSRTPKQIGQALIRAIYQSSEHAGSAITSTEIYQYGIYKYLIGKVGKPYTNYLIVSEDVVRPGKEVSKLMKERNALYVGYITHLRRALILFLTKEEIEAAKAYHPEQAD